jgi:hypothetical protein
VSNASGKLLLGCLAGLTAAAIVLGAWSGWPVYNDSYFVGLIRELGVDSILPMHVDRPLYGVLMESLARAFGQTRGPYIAIALGSWTVLAWQTIRLWGRLYPEAPALGSLAALLIVSPILVETQYTTVTLIIPVNLPVSLCLAGLLVALRPPPERLRFLVLSAALAAAAAAVSEYGVATMAASAALLFVLRRFRSAAFLIVGGAAGYLVFRILSDESAVEWVDPSVQVPKVLNDPVHAAANWITGVFHALIGAWLSAIGTIRLDAESRSTWLAVALGLFAAVVVARAVRGLSVSAGVENPGRRLWALAAAVATGILLVVLAARAPAMPSILSRVRTPVLPFAAIALVAVVWRVFAIRYRTPAFAFLAFLATYRVVDGAFEARRQQQTLESVGEELRPLVEDSPGITVAVLPWLSDRNDLPHRVTFRWSDAEVKRAWVLFPDQAEDLFGPRVACHDTARIALPRQLDNRSPERLGAVSHLVWVPLEDDFVGDPEPYCIGSVGSKPPPEARSPTR